MKYLLLCFSWSIQTNKYSYRTWNGKHYDVFCYIKYISQCLCLNKFAFILKPILKFGNSVYIQFIYSNTLTFWAPRASLLLLGPFKRIRHVLIWIRCKIDKFTLHRHMYIYPTSIFLEGNCVTERTVSSKY